MELWTSRSTRCSQTLVNSRNSTWPLEALTGPPVCMLITSSQGCGLGRDVSVSRRTNVSSRSRLGLGSEGLVHIPASSC